MKPPPVPDDHPTILFSRYELGKLLGKGTFAKVYQAKDLTQTPPTTVAIKIISKDNIRRENLSAQILREISVMRLVRHPHVVDLYEVMATKSRIFFVMQLVNGGELFAKIVRGRLREDVARKYFQQLISAVDFCHKRGVSHRDLKPENLLLDEEGNLKVSDFGLSSLPEQLRQDGLLHTQCGTPAYVAPEVLRKKGYDGAKDDLWSCGVILYVLLTGFLPFQDENLMKMYAKVFKADYKIPAWVSPGACHLISRILVADPNKRITVPEIMNSPWFKHGLTSPTTELTLTSTVDSDPSGPKAAPAFYNAFELISAMSPGFDLSGMFESRRKAGTVFTSRRSSGEIVRALVAVGERLGYEVGRVGDYKVSYGGKKCGCNSGLVVTAEVFEVVDGVAVVEFERRAGVEEDYAKFCEEDVRPGLKEVVWTWQGDCRSEPEVS